MDLEALLATWSTQLLLASIGVAAVALGFYAARRLARGDAVAAHRGAQLAVIAALCLIPAQFLVPPRSEGALAHASREATQIATAWLAAATPAAAREGGAVAPGPVAPSMDAGAQGSVEVAPIPAAGRPEGTRSAAGELPATVDAGEASGPNAMLTPSGVAAAAGAIHLAVLALLLLRLARDARVTRRLLEAATPLPDDLADARFLAATGEARPRDVRLLASDAIATPCCAARSGWRAILLPRGVAADLALLHEWIHLGRRDPHFQRLERIFVALFWFHPLAHSLARRLGELRELSCDQRVVELTGRRRSYARALVDHAAQEPPDPDSRDALLAWNRHPSLLERRIEMITRTDRRPRVARRIALTSSAAAALAAVLFWHVSLAAAWPSEASAGESLLAYCPPKKESCEPKTPPADPRGKKETDLKTPRGKGKPASGKTGADLTQNDREERARRLEELLGSRRGNAGDAAANAGAGLRLAGATLSPAVAAAPLDAEIQQALIRTLLRDDHPAARATAAAALAPHLDLDAVKDAFSRALADSRDPQLRLVVLDALLERETISDPARELFARLFAKDAAELTRVSLAEALSPFADDPDARDVLIEALLDGANPAVQVTAANSLRGQAADSKVAEAMIKVLRHSSNEVARVAVIDSLAEQAGNVEEIAKVFREILMRDDNPVARLAVADGLAAGAADPKVRALMIDVLPRGIAVTLQMKILDSLAPHVAEPDVKRAFVANLERIENAVLRTRMVEALAGLATPGRERAGRPAFETDPRLPGSPHRDAGATLIPVGGPATDRG
jgi:beta-lactamase regulating signal transducer with metallopeptidase domain